MESSSSNRLFQCLVIACCLMVALEARNQQVNQPPRANPVEFENFRIGNDVLVLLPPGVNFTELQTRNRTIKLSADTFNQDPRMENYYRASDDGDLLDNTDNPRSGARESRRVNLLRGLFNKPKVSPLYLVNGTVCRFVNSAPICTTLTTTGIMPSATSLSLGRSGGFTTDVQFPGFNFQQQQPQQQQQQFPNQQSQFPNNQQPQQQQQQQQFPQNQQQFPNNPQQGSNQQQQQQQQRPTIG